MNDGGPLRSRFLLSPRSRTFVESIPGTVSLSRVVGPWVRRFETPYLITQLR
jgi:hypothetical protein